MPSLPDIASLSSAASSKLTLPCVSSVAESSHTPLRRTEKHFKNRSQPLKFPSLRSTPTQPILDLSRPVQQEDDEVWQAGWWSPSSDLTGRVKKGKERDRGERPPLETEGSRRILLSGGKVGWVIADGKASRHTG